MNTHISTILCLVVLFIFSTCSKDKESECSYPRVTTEPVTNINTNGATFKGTFLQVGHGEIIDHGFVFDISSAPAIRYSERISLGPSSGSGIFTAIASRNLKVGQEYYVSAYAQNKDKTFYAEPVVFISKGGASPEIINIEPSEGLKGDTIIINGKNFSLLAYNNYVKFGEQETITISASETVLTVRVPEANGSEYVDILVTTAGKTAKKTKGFRYVKF